MKAWRGAVYKPLPCAAYQTASSSCRRTASEMWGTLPCNAHRAIRDTSDVLEACADLGGFVPP